jgi:hypothetical protein
MCPTQKQTQARESSKNAEAASASFEPSRAAQNPLERVKKNCRKGVLVMRPPYPPILGTPCLNKRKKLIFKTPDF